ncbi:RagB/SusD family nutrient uptake outer membrane protein [Chitinophaga agrisoli]|uniref:RagB/SusD family nutrient uptake outer membrane protein n=1 Tax=Chitinophaga agrisoli TaxID=2607653 RepID=A0A5B2VVE1_9BACT|nr:RagB/SusD family nutrient uptake outer membrane protein [Chitinophaga agrisoli]KAA2243231.1 RagB/SusD family nutrient uptake outer membrane protein [Chitinophaga agrisoli]
MLTAYKYSKKSKVVSICIIMAGLFLSGCSKQLNITPEVFVSPEALYKDEAGIKAGVVGLYRQLLDLKRSDYVIVGMVGTDEAKTTLFVPTWGTYWQNFCAVNTYSQLMTSQNDVIQWFWVICYRGINNANTAIRYIPGAAAPDAVKNQGLGEAKFMRGLFYFYLVQLYGGVPLPTEEKSEVSDQKGGLPRSTPEQVYELIEKDLEFAAANLKSKGGNGTQVGAATKEAAMALLGKVYLTEKKYDKAKAALEPLLAASNVKLMDNYADLYVETNENNIESLFEVQFSNENNNTSNLANNLGSWQVNDLALPGGGGHVIIPTDYYFNSFEAGDKRKAASFRWEFFDKDGNPVDYSWWSDVGKPHMKKFDITKGISVSGSYSSRNLYYLRLADAILMYAEAENELGGTAVALQQLNRIRTRAGLDNYEIVHGAPSQDQLRKEIMVERMRELGFEGWRWFDLKRTGTLLQAVKDYNPDGAPNIQEKHLLYPIPTWEFDNNQSLSRADQNAGY